MNLSEVGISLRDERRMLLTLIAILLEQTGGSIVLNEVDLINYADKFKDTENLITTTQYQDPPKLVVRLNIT